MRHSSPLQNTGSVKQAFEKQSVPKRKKSKPLPRITIRLTPEEKQRLDEMADGMALAAYVRACVFNGEMKPVRRRRPTRDEQAIAQLLGILGQSRIANNLNQLAKLANIGCLPVSPDVEQDIHDACTDIADMRAMLVTALGLKNGGRS